MAGAGGRRGVQAGGEAGGWDGAVGCGFEVGGWWVGAVGCG